MESLDSSSYQRVRLWSGVTTIGLQLTAVWSLYLMVLPLHALPEHPLFVLLAGLVFTLGWAALFLPLEILTGHAVESAVGRTRQPLFKWLQDWFKSQLLTLPGIGIGFCLFAWIAPLNWSTTLGVATLLFFLVWLFTRFLNLLFNALMRPYLKHHPELEHNINQQLEKWSCSPIKLSILDDGGDEGVNGMIMPGKPPSIPFTINAHASDSLTPWELAALAAREQWFMKSQFCMNFKIKFLRISPRTLSHLVCSFWIATGFIIACSFPGLILPAHHAIHYALGGLALFTTWCFLALLTWPPLSNHHMLQADAHLVSLIGAESTQNLLEKIQRLNGSDTHLHAAKEHVFHPIPSLNRRIQSLRLLHQPSTP
ncbi:MAG: hypothetical protein ACFCUX_08955 [Candidatus Methylacidiphilales bacterium]